MATDHDLALAQRTAQRRDTIRHGTLPVPDDALLRYSNWIERMHAARCGEPEALRLPASVHTNAWTAPQPYWRDGEE